MTMPSRAERDARPDPQFGSANKGARMAIIMTRYLVAFLAAAVTTSARSADLPVRQAPEPAPIAEADEWSFSFTGYLWGSALTGRAASLPPLPAVNVDMKFVDILKNFQGGLMGMAELRIGRWSFMTDGMFSQVSPGARLPGPYFSSAKLRAQSLTVQATALYRLYSDPMIDIDAGAGVRYWNLDNRLRIAPGSLNLALTRSESEHWFDPVVAARLLARLGGPWSLSVYGDIGSFDVGSRLTWQALGTVNYDLSRNWSLRVGYRALHVDYREGRYLYDMTMHGPILGATYRF